MSFDDVAFHQLRSNRLAYIEGLRRNKGFEAGILRLLTQLYPDNAHFIFELLQNAEDARASHAHFHLNDDCLIFEHDGSRLFSARDVESITSIGDSTKADSPTDIGKFGVGFKAVFAYTQTPEIYSGDYSFRIHDLVVPDLVSLTDGAVGSRFTTKFKFPFNHPGKAAQNAIAEISNALEKLDETALLFLSNIQCISYVLSNGSSGRLERLPTSDPQRPESNGERIVISVQGISNEARDTHWLRYKKVASINDDSIRKECIVSVAFRLKEVETESKRQSWAVIPLNPGRVCIYFPAEKETSNLRFHLHAPFASTVARDSVRDVEGNRKLIEALAELAAESMTDIRDHGLLNTSFLEVLPIEDDGLSSLYHPVRDKIVDAFRTNDLVPTRYGVNRAADDLFRGPASITNLLTDADLAFLTRGKFANVAWCANPPQANQRADKFLDSLEIDKWSWPNLCESLDCDYFSNNDGWREAIVSWLSEKPDAWIFRLYAVLNGAINDYYYDLNVDELEIVRVELDGKCKLVKPSEAFFPAPAPNPTPKDVWVVKPEVYLHGKSESQQHRVRQFLESIGVRVFDEAVEISRLIDLYSTESPPNVKSHLKHIVRFVEFFKLNPSSIGLFIDKPIFLGQIEDSRMELRYASTKSLYLDSPFEETGLAGTVAVKKKFRLWDGYEKIASNKELIELVRALGIQTCLQIERASTRNNPKKDLLFQDYYRAGVRWMDSAIDEDWTIIGIESLVRNPTLHGSKLLWTALTRASPKTAIARFRPNKQYVPRQAESQLVHCLKSCAWIPDEQGNFFKPQDIKRSQLPQGFLFDDRNGLLTAIGFEESVKRQTEEFQRKDVAAKAIGFAGIDEANELANAVRESGMNAKAIATLIRQHSVQLEQPEEEVKNPDRRRRVVHEHRDNAPSRESVKRERAIQANVEPVIAEARAYLRAKYTNGQHQMVCQGCRQEMPFKLSTGEYFFEAIQVIRGIAKHYYENRIALCPTCAAKYRYARTTDDDALKAEISKIDSDTAGPSIELAITMAGVASAIRFVGTHFFDLKEVLDSHMSKF